MGVYERIKEMCKLRGVTVSELEAHVGLGKKTIYNWKTSAPSADKLQQVAKALDVTVDYLLGNVEVPNYAGHSYNMEGNLTVDAKMQNETPYGKVLQQLEMLHKKPRLGVLLSSSSKLDQKGIDAVIEIVERMNAEEENE